MKNSLLPLFAGVTFLAFSQMASATLLIGFNSFDATANPEAKDAGSFSGTVTKNTTSVASGGSNDNTYGNSTVALPGTGNGNLRSNSAGVTTFTITNSTASAYSLQSFLFDATLSAGNVFGLTYKINAGPTLGLALTNPGGPVGTPSGTTATSSVVQDYGDYVASLVGVTLTSGSVIQFFISASAGARLDNIALTSIPEPGSLLALGALVGSGAFLRSRRRGGPAVLA